MNPKLRKIRKQMMIRPATKSGSWYESHAKTLSTQLGAWKEACEVEDGVAPSGTVRAIITPHAGYRYSGATASYCYNSLDPSGVKRVYVLGPSHHVHLSNTCRLSSASLLETPFGNLTVDREECETLARNHKELFKFWESNEDDEEEHSLELQFPMIYYIFSIKFDRVPGRDYQIIPICVGSLGESTEARIGSILSTKFADPSNLFVISSDFCHFGSRFGYQYVMNPKVPLYRSIEEMDRRGMSIIAAKSHADFVSYLKETRNTICGRHPIGVLLGMIEALGEGGKERVRVEFLKYAQSSECRDVNKDSSVSYAAAVVKFL